MNEPMEIWVNFYPNRKGQPDAFGMVFRTEEEARAYRAEEGWQTKLFREVLEESQVVTKQQQQKEKVT